MYLTVEELYTHLHDETVNAISRDTDAIPIAAIDAAKSEVKSYLYSYDIDTEFASEGEKRNPLLLLFVKDVAVWHFVNLGNVCTDMELREKRYDRAIEWLRAVQKGDLTADLPVKTADEDGNAVIGQIAYGSNRKREQHY